MIYLISWSFLYIFPDVIIKMYMPALQIDGNSWLLTSKANSPLFIILGVMEWVEFILLQCRFYHYFREPSEYLKVPNNRLDVFSELSTWLHISWGWTLSHIETQEIDTISKVTGSHEYHNQHFRMVSDRYY